MANCNGNCASCGGCARELVLTEKEIGFLQELGQIPFLPVARKMGDLNPVYLEAGPDAAEEYSLLLQLLEKKGLVSLDFGVGRVFKLLRNKDVWILCLHFKSSLQTFFNTSTNVACIVNKYNLCTIVFHQFSAFLTDGIRHYNFGFITSYCTNKCKSDTLVTACRLYNYSILVYYTLFFRFAYHIECSSCFYRASYI